MSQQPAGPKLSYTVDDACEVTGLNRNSFYRAVSTNEIATFKVGKRRMVSARALQDFIDRKEREAQQGRAAAA